MGMLFENASDNDFMLPSGFCKGKGKGRVVVVDSVVESPDCLSPAAAAGCRIRRKSWRKALADEDEVVRYNYNYNDSDGDSESDEDGPRGFLGAQRMKRRPSSSSVLTFCHHCRSKMRRPKMRCTLINKMTCKRCCKLFCDMCIEKRLVVPPVSIYDSKLSGTLKYPEFTFDLSSNMFACPAVCRNYCNCSLCVRRRGEMYVSERGIGLCSNVAPPIEDQLPLLLLPLRAPPQVRPRPRVEIWARWHWPRQSSARR